MNATLEEQMKAAEEKWLEGWKKGPTRLRWTELPLQVGDQAKDFTLLDSHGNSVRLSDFWKDRPALIIFWRHFGCGCGVDRNKRLQGEYDSYVEKGANVIIIGQGEPERSSAYAEKYKLPPVPILSDLDHNVYAAYGLLEGKPSQIMFDAPDEYLDRDYEAGVKIAKSRKKDNRPLVDNTWLLPGEFVIDQAGIVRLTYRYNYCEDFPDHRVLLSAIREATIEFTK